MIVSPLDFDTDLAFWRELYADPVVKEQMYAPPADDAEFRKYFAHAYVVRDNGVRIGGFTVERTDGRAGTFGFVIRRDFRNKGYGMEVLNKVIEKARELGITSLRADVYTDNKASLRVLEQAGFREFVWLEKNL